MAGAYCQPPARRTAAPEVAGLDEFGGGAGLGFGDVGSGGTGRVVAAGAEPVGAAAGAGEEEGVAEGGLSGMGWRFHAVGGSTG